VKKKRFCQEAKIQPRKDKGFPKQYKFIHEEK
jgi:hypothetical protein